MHVVIGKKNVKLPFLTTIFPGNFPIPGNLPMRVITAPSTSKIIPNNINTFPVELAPFTLGHLRSFQNIIPYPTALSHGSDSL
jgi:hypothetical protein